MNGEVFAVVVLPDGKIVIGGRLLGSQMGDIFRCSRDGLEQAGDGG